LTFSLVSMGHVAKLPLIMALRRVDGDGLKQALCKKTRWVGGWCEIGDEAIDCEIVACCATV
jgi:hypothetical protein